MWTTDFSEETEEAYSSHYEGEKRVPTADRRELEADGRLSKDQRAEPIIAQPPSSGEHFAQAAPGTRQDARVDAHPLPRAQEREHALPKDDLTAIPGLPPDLDLSQFNEDERAHLIAMFSKAQELETERSRPASPQPPIKAVTTTTAMSVYEAPQVTSQAVPERTQPARSAAKPQDLQLAVNFWSLII